jgi:hypothetical protein
MLIFSGTPMCLLHIADSYVTLKPCFPAAKAFLANATKLLYCMV